MHLSRPSVTHALRAGRSSSPGRGATRLAGPRAAGRRARAGHSPGRLLPAVRADPAALDASGRRSSCARGLPRRWPAAPWRTASSTACRACVPSAAAGAVAAPSPREAMRARAWRMVFRIGLAWTGHAGPGSRLSSERAQRPECWSAVQGASFGRAKAGVPVSRWTSTAQPVHAGLRSMAGHAPGDHWSLARKAPLRTRAAPAGTGDMERDAPDGRRIGGRAGVGPASRRARCPRSLRIRTRWAPLQG
jgi:hypothetical protein